MTIPKSILIVEDELPLLQFFKRVLETAGHHITTVSTMEDAQAQLNSERFDLCICDMQIGEHSGIEILRHPNHDRFVVISSNPDYENYCREWGIPFYLKPVTYSDLIDITK